MLPLAGCLQKEVAVNEDPHAVMNHGGMTGMMGDADGSGELFSKSVEGLPEAKPSEVISLKNGDIFEMTASLVKQEVGNRVIKRLAYNGQIPGPLLSIPKGSEISLKFNNESDVNTTIHSHGIRLDNAFDGVPDITQKPVKPGESFTYQLKFPDEGIYWYHPHIREDYAQELGLYGSFLVEPGSPDYWNPVSREEFLILDDMLISENQPTFPVSKTDHALMGRFGNILLINNEEDYQIAVRKDETIRLFVTNVANARPFNFRIADPSGSPVKLKLVGGDNGRIEKETFVDSLLITPSERYVAEVHFSQEGTFEIQNDTPDRTYVMGRLTVTGEAENNLASAFDTLRDNSADFEDIRGDFADLLQKTPDKSVTLSVSGMSMMSGDHRLMEGMMNGSEEIEWEDDMAAMNSLSTSKNTTWEIIDDATGAKNMDIDWHFRQGDLVKIRIFNDPKSMHPMQHPIHFHGQRFLVLTRDKVPNDNLQWKDTTLIKAGETVDLIVEMENPGTWMAHCHIAEHLHAGMMLSFTVGDVAVGFGQRTDRQ